MRRIFGANPRLDRVTAQQDRILLEIQRLTCGNSNLPFHEVQPRHAFRNRMFDLEARVHFDEVEPIVVCQEELDRSGVLVADCGGSFTGCPGEPGAHRRIETGGRRLLDHLLMSPLQGAVALEQVDRAAVAVGEDLHFDMAGRRHQLLDQEATVPEGGFRLARCRVERLAQFGFGIDAPQSPATAARHGLDQHRVAERTTPLGNIGDRLYRKSRKHRNPGALHAASRRILVSHQANGVGRRPDPAKARRHAGLREFRVLGQEAIAGMDGIDPCPPGGGKQAIGIEIAQVRRRRPQRHDRVDGAGVQCFPIRPRGHTYRGNSQATAGTRDPRRDFAAVGDQNTFEHRC